MRFASIEWHRIMGRNHMAIVACPEDLVLKTGDTVTLDGNKVKVLGIDRTMQLRTPPDSYRAGERIGLLVDIV